VRVYNPPWRGLVGALVALDAVAMSAGSHNKILILDDGEGAVAIVGGRNVSRHSFVALAEDPGAVRDADVLVDGAVAAAAAAALAREFDAAGNDEIVADRWNLRSPRDELVLLARAMDAWLFGAAPAVRPGADDVEVDGAARALLTVATRSLDHAIDDTTSARVRGQLHALVRSRSVWGALAGPLTATTAQTSPGPRIDAEVALVSSPSRAQRAANDNQPLQAWLIALAGARDSVVLESPSFILSPALLLAMQAASARGVDITVLTDRKSTRLNSSHP
jgi:phosphatidylserine/phosphatidylglycerophosphate/cardiolipin synthase-like enzyme